MPCNCYRKFVAQWAHSIVVRPCTSFLVPLLLIFIGVGCIMPFFRLSPSAGVEAWVDSSSTLSHNYDAWLMSVNNLDPVEVPKLAQEEEEVIPYQVPWNFFYESSNTDLLNNRSDLSLICEFENFFLETAQNRSPTSYVSLGNSFTHQLNINRNCTHIAELSQAELQAISTNMDNVLLGIDPNLVRSNFFLWGVKESELAEIEQGFLDFFHMEWRGFQPPYHSPAILGTNIQVQWHCTILQQIEMDRIVQTDMMWTVASLAFVYFWISVHTGSFFMASVTIFSVVSSLVFSYFILRFIIQIKFFAELHILAIFVVAGIGADDAFIFLDAFHHSKLRLQEGKVVDQIIEIFGLEQDEVDTRASVSSSMEAYTEDPISSEASPEENTIGKPSPKTSQDDSDEDHLHDGLHDISLDVENTNKISCIENSNVVKGSWGGTWKYAASDEKLYTKQMYFAISRALSSTFYTSCTTAVSFIATAASPVMPIASFGIYAAITIMVLYVFTLCLIPSALMFKVKVIDVFFKRVFRSCARGEKIGGDFPVEEANDRSKSFCTNANKALRKISDFIINAYADLVTSFGRLVPAILVLVFITFGILGGIHAMKLQTPSTFEQWFKADHMFTTSAELNTGENFLASEPSSYTTITMTCGIQGIDRGKWDKFKVRTQDTFLGSPVYSEEFILSPEGLNGFDSLCNQLHSFNCSTSEEGCSDDGGVETLSLTPSASFTNCFIDSFRNYVSNKGFDYLAMNATELNSELIKFRNTGATFRNNIGVINGTVKFLSINFKGLIKYTSSASMKQEYLSIVDFIFKRDITPGFCYALGWSLGIAESIAGTIVVGLSVDYVVHLGHLYIDSGKLLREPTSKTRCRITIEDLACTIAAGALTTLGAGLF
eukprot:g759.t1